MNGSFKCIDISALINKNEDLKKFVICYSQNN